MFDSRLRPLKDRWLTPIASAMPSSVSPTAVSIIGLLLTLGAAVAASQRLTVAAVALFLLGRLADGLDGLMARSRRRASDFGGLIDIVFDVIGYAALPIGVAFGVDDRAAWIATGVLLATFYVNATSWAYLAALLEKRGVGPGRSQPTSVVMPRGLVEGTETIVFFVIALALVDAATTVWWIMAVAVALTATDRIRWAARQLR